MAPSLFVVVVAMTLTLISSQTNAEELDVYRPQVQLYVDKSAVDKWKSNTGSSDMDRFKTELQAYFVNVNDFYKSLSKHGNLRIEFGVQNITLLDTNVLPNEGYMSTSANYAMPRFKNWITPQYASNPYDIAVLFTGYKFVNMYGIAKIGQVCTKLGIVVMMYTGFGQDTVVLAHELGHSLGADHDEDQYSDQSCYVGKNTIMVPQAPVWFLNRFSFSWCSYSSFHHKFVFLKAENKNCLQDDADKVETGTYFGSLLTADDLCHRVTAGWGVTYLDRTSYESYPNDVCLKLHCKGKERDTYTSTPQGLRCGKNKICKLGECVDDPAGSPLTADTCPFGDQPRIGTNYDKTCFGIQPAECETYKKECCLSCDSTNPLYNMTADDACKLLDGPNSVFMRSAYKTYGDAMCSKLVCSSNKYGEGFKYNKYPTPEGFACGKDKRCMAGKCTATNHGNPAVTSDTCPFGDQDTKGLNYSKTCPQYAEKLCYRWGPTCCQSCQGKY